jgi:hypothetical protein
MHSLSRLADFNGDGCESLGDLPHPRASVEGAQPTRHGLVERIGNYLDGMLHAV